MHHFTYTPLTSSNIHQQKTKHINYSKQKSQQKSSKAEKHKNTNNKFATTALCLQRQLSLELFGTSSLPLHFAISNVLVSANPTRLPNI